MEMSSPVVSPDLLRVHDESELASWWVCVAP